MPEKTLPVDDLVTLFICKKGISGIICPKIRKTRFAVYFVSLDMSSSLTKHTILKMLEANKAQLTAFGVQEIGLFGSYVRGEATAKSDIDLLVDIRKDKKNLRNYLNIVYFLEDLFNNKVELITKQSLSKHIGPRILETVEYVSIAN